MGDLPLALLAIVSIVVTVMLVFVVWPAVIGWKYRDRPATPEQRSRLARLLVGLGIVMLALVPVGLMLGAKAPYLGMISLATGGLASLLSGLTQLRALKKERPAQPK